MLQDYARNLKGMLPSAGYTLARVAQILRGMRGAFDTMDTYGPSKQGRIVLFLKLYPNIFTIQGSGPKCSQQTLRLRSLHGLSRWEVLAVASIPVKGVESRYQQRGSHVL